MAIDLTLLVPCFNAASLLPTCVDTLGAWAAAHPARRIELLVVDDGSTDGTCEVSARLAHPALEIVTDRATENGGKGAALRRGVQVARGRQVVFLDVDLAVGPQDLDPLLAALDAGADLAAGCRNVPGACIARPQGFWRRNLGRAYLRFARFTLGIRAPDVTCGFKAFDRARVGPLLLQTRSRRWGLDAELLYLARRAGLVVTPVAVTWQDGAQSTVRLGRDVGGAFQELMATRIRGWTGAYDVARIGRRAGAVVTADPLPTSAAGE
jgi:dolichyl-phosphate beta-glucosyltransferase